jgi:hypothetical protein
LTFHIKGSGEVIMAYHHAYLRSQEVSLVIVSLPGLGGGGRGSKLQPVRKTHRPPDPSGA